MLRVWATTDGSEAGRIALEYVKSLMRIGEVRIIPSQGAGIWPGYERLLNTPLAGPFVNVVICPPDQWVRLIRVTVPAKADPVVGEALSSSWEIEHTPHTRGAGGNVLQKDLPVAETITDRTELWTINVRNVLFALGQPRDQFQLASAKKYDALIVPSERSAHVWRSVHGAKPGVIEVPVANHDMMQGAVFGVPTSDTIQETRDADPLLR